MRTLGQRPKPRGGQLDLVAELLRWRALSLAELAVLLDRTQDHVRKTYVNELVNAGVVAMTIPENPTDPRQKYFAKRRSGV